MLAPRGSWKWLVVPGYTVVTLKVGWGAISLLFLSMPDLSLGSFPWMFLSPGDARCLQTLIIAGISFINKGNKSL